MQSDSGSAHPDAGRDLLRHTVATLAYRASKAFHGAREDFADFHASETSRTPGEILAHMGDLFDWALSIAKGKQEWHDSPSLPWAEGVKRFFAALELFDAYLATEQPLAASAPKLFQGPVADALTLRRLAGSPIRGENYFRAAIIPGCVGAEQPPAVREFD